MKLTETLSIFVYKLLDWLKQESPFWWFVVQSVLWLMLGLIYFDMVPTFGHKEIFLMFLLSLTSGVGTRTSKKLSEVKPTITANSFKQGFQEASDKIEQDKEMFSPKENEKPQIELTPSTTQTITKFLKPGQWIANKAEKKQIYLHHSVGGSVDSLYNQWNSNKDRVGTAYSIDRDGKVYQHFPDNEWAYHLYVSAKGNKVDKKYKTRDETLNKESIGIELVSMGGLNKRSGKWYSIYNTIVPTENVFEVNFRGFKGFERYTPEQIVSLKKLLLQLSDRFNIPFNPITFNISNEALNSVPGVFTHVNVRSDKSDCFPDPNLIEMINELNRLKDE